MCKFPFANNFGEILDCIFYSKGSWLEGALKADWKIGRRSFSSVSKDFAPCKEPGHPLPPKSFPFALRESWREREDEDGWRRIETAQVPREIFFYQTPSSAE